MKYASPEKQIYARMRQGAVKVPMLEGMNSTTAKRVEKLLTKMKMTDEEGDKFFSLVSSKGTEKGISEFLKKHSKFKKYEDELELVADAMGF